MTDFGEAKLYLYLICAQKCALTQLVGKAASPQTEAMLQKLDPSVQSLYLPIILVQTILVLSQDSTMERKTI